MFEIFCVEASAAMGVRKFVREKVERGECLVCECKAEKRGLCATHVNHYYYARRSMSKREQAAFEAKLIKQGKLLPQYDKTYSTKNVFARMARQSS